VEIRSALVCRVVICCSTLFDYLAGYAKEEADANRLFIPGLLIATGACEVSVLSDSL